MWIVVVAPIVFIEFIWVPYRLEDGSVDWSWSWNPPRVIAEWDRKVFEQIRKEWRKEQNGKKEDAQTDRRLTPSPSIPASRARRIRSQWGRRSRGFDWPGLSLLLSDFILHWFLRYGQSALTPQ